MKSGELLRANRIQAWCMGMSWDQQRDLFRKAEESFANEGMFDAQLSFNTPLIPQPEPIRTIVKRNGREAPFDTAKIADAIFRAIQSVGEGDRDLARGLAAGVSLFLTKRISASPPNVDDVNDAVEHVLMEMGHPRAAIAFAKYRDRRTRIRRFRDGDVRAFLDELDEARRSAPPIASGPSLFVRTSQEQIADWDREKIVEALVRETNLDRAIAEVVAVGVEQQIVRAGVRTLSTSLVRELVDAKLIEMGREDLRRRHMRLGVPLYDAEGIICAPNADDGVGGHTPADTDRLLAQRVKREFALSHVFSQEVADAHLAGDLHLHGLGTIDRLAEGRYPAGLVTHLGAPVDNGKRLLGPASYALPAVHQLAAAQAALQVFHGEPIVWEGLDLFLAPLLMNGDPRNLREAAQQVFNLFGPRSAGSARLGLWCSAPNPAATASLPGHAATDTYADWAHNAAAFTAVLLDEGLCGDVGRGNWLSPHLEVTVNDALLSDTIHPHVLTRAAQAVQSGAQLSIRFGGEDGVPTGPWQPWQPWSLTAHRVTLNLPRLAFAAHGDENRFWTALDNLCALAAEAHLQKHAYLEKLFGLGDIGPLALLGRVWKGTAFADPRSMIYVTGIAGLNECAHALTGRQLHESDDALACAHRILTRIAECSAQSALQESARIVPGWTADREARCRLASLDARAYPDWANKVVQYEGLTPDVTYTAGAQLAAASGVSTFERLAAEGRFHAIVPHDAVTRLHLSPEAASAEQIVTVILESVHRGQCRALEFVTA